MAPQTYKHRVAAVSPGDVREYEKENGKPDSLYVARAKGHVFEIYNDVGDQEVICISDTVYASEDDADAVAKRLLGRG